MPLNYALKGKEYEEVTFEVERGRVTQFAEAVGEDDPVFLDPEAAGAAGFAEQVAPPTFPTVMQIMTSGQVVLDQELGLNYALVVHGEQAYEWRRPIVVGDVLRATPRIADVYARGPNEFLIIEAEITDAAGEVVCLARTTLLSRGTAGEG
ncbi:MAG TPA: MaoC family dehydratase N-terminal domain-containing protein [Actinomycetota bacterium]|nr:MaoC family dehydratase N-terminal domain-containing protein [Actinomycetota bacterium]